MQEALVVTYMLAAFGALFVAFLFTVRRARNERRRLVLELLAYGDEMSSFEFVGDLGSPVYSILRELEADGLVKCREAAGGLERGGRPNFFYSLTPRGLVAIRRGGS